MARRAEDTSTLESDDATDTRKARKQKVPSRYTEDFDAAADGIYVFYAIYCHWLCVDNILPIPYMYW